MDATSCVRRLNEAMDDNDRDGCLAALADLFEWLGKGGFPPSTDALEDLCEGSRNGFRVFYGLSAAPTYHVYREIEGFALRSYRPASGDLDRSYFIVLNQEG